MRLAFLQNHILLASLEMAQKSVSITRAYSLIYIEYEVKDRGGNGKADKVSDFGINRDSVREVRETENGEDKHNSDSEAEEPLKTKTELMSQ